MIIFKGDDEMKQLKVNLNQFSNIPLFVQASMSVPQNIYVKSNNCCVNAKSIMGLYSLNLLEPVCIEIEDDAFPQSFLNKIKDMIIN